MVEKKYINMCKIKEVHFDNGGSVINVSFNVEELSKLANSEGWINLTIAKRREESDKGATHYAYLNEFTPKPKVKHDQDDLVEEDLPF